MANNGHGLGFEQKLWSAADKMRNNMDAAEYKHVVLGLIFLKYISDSFEEKRRLLEKAGDDLEDRDFYTANDIPNPGDKGVFWVPKKARWDFLQDHAKQPEVGKFLDEAMESIEKENTSLKGVLPKDYARPALDKRRLGELIDLIGTIGLGDEESRKKDILGRVYEYFLGEFADAEGKKGGQFYTPRSIVGILVEMLEPYKGRVYDPCCGSGGMFVQSERFIKEHQGRINDISIFGQESNPTTWKLAKMNMAIRGIDCNIALGDTFHDDQHKDLKANFIIANPPFNVSDWNGESLRDDPRWKYGIPPTGNANFAWVQHMIYHLAPNGAIGLVLANGSMSSNTSGEGDIRKSLVENDLVDCMIALPSQLFYNTQIPACLWFFRKNKGARAGEVLFIDARKMGEMISRKNRNLTTEDIGKITSTYHKWKNGEDVDELGFAKSTNREDMEKHSFILTPGRYVGTEEEVDDGISFEDKMKELTSELATQMEEGKKLDKEIKKNLESIGFKVK